MNDMIKELLPYIVAICVFLGYCVFAWKKPGWGLALLVFAIAGIVVIAATVEDPMVLIIAAFLFPVTIGLVRCSPSGSPLETPWYQAVASAVIMMLQYILLLAILTFVFNVFGPLLFVLFVVAVVRYKQTHKYSLALDIVSAIGMSMRQSLPLPMALTTAANGQKRKESKIFLAIADWLTKGYSLSESLRRGYRKCPPELLASITAAEKMDQLPETIRTLELDISEKVMDYKRVRPVHPWYPLLVAFVAFFIIMGLALFIVPTFAEVLNDMSDGQAGLPKITQILLNSSMWIKGRNGLNFLFILVLPLIPVIVLSQPRRRRHGVKGPTLLSRLSDWLKWHLPIMHGFERSYSQLQLIETLKVGLRSGYPFNAILQNTLGLDMNLCYRKQIGSWLEAVEQGSNISDSARRCGIGGMLAWALDDSLNKGNAPLIFESMEAVYRSRYNYRLNLVNSVICPLMVIALGCGVGFVVTAMFLPMVKIIQVMM